MTKTQNQRRNRRTPHFDAKAYVAEQYKAVHGAGELAGELAGIARGLYAEKHGAECPADRIPSPDALRDPDFLRSVEADTWEEYGQSLAVLIPFDNEAQRDQYAQTLAQIGGAGMAPALEADAEAWRAKPESERGKHPAAPFVEAWQALEGHTPDKLPYGRMPGAVRNASGLIVRREYGESVSIAEVGYDGSSQIPLFPEEEKTFAPYCFLLQSFDEGGGKPYSGGGGVTPFPLRLHTELLLSYPYELRSAGKARIVVTIQDLIDFLGLKRFRFDTHYIPLVRGLFAIDALRLVYPDGATWRLVGITGTPRPDPAAEITVDIALPPGEIQGALIHRPTLREYGPQSERLFRAWLGVSEYWNRHGMQRGKLIRATRPQVERNEAGYVTDTAGNVLATLKGRPQRSANDPRAIRTGQAEANPARKAYPFLDMEAIRGLVFGPAEPGISKDTRKKHKQRALKTLQEMEADGKVLLEYNGSGGVRILPPAWYWTGAK